MATGWLNSRHHGGKTGIIRDAVVIAAIGVALVALISVRLLHATGPS